LLDIALPAPASSSLRKRLIVSPEQMQALLRVPSRLQTIGKRDRAILCLLCEGLSAQEIGALKRDMDWDSELNVSEVTRAVLRDYNERARPLLSARLNKKRRYSSRLFFSNRGTPLSPVAIQQIVRRHAEAARLPGWVSSTTLARSGALRRAGSEALASLPRAAHLRLVYAKAHPRSS
jgi:site-specific recombinase XerD